MIGCTRRLTELVRMNVSQPDGMPQLGQRLHTMPVLAPHYGYWHRSLHRYRTTQSHPITPYGDAKRNPYATPQSGPDPGTRADNDHHGNSRHDRPETIARMTIIKPHLTRLRTWHGTQHQHARSGIPNRTESMFHTHGPLSYHRIEYRDSPYCIAQCCGTTNGRVC